MRFSQVESGSPQITAKSLSPHAVSNVRQMRQPNYKMPKRVRH
jgi:hypothetical protein